MWTPLGPSESVLNSEVSWFQGWTFIIRWDKPECPDYTGCPDFRVSTLGFHCNHSLQAFIHSLSCLACGEQGGTTVPDSPGHTRPPCTTQAANGEKVHCWGKVLPTSVHGHDVQRFSGWLVEGVGAGSSSLKFTLVAPIVKKKSKANTILFVWLLV